LTYRQVVRADVPVLQAMLQDLARHEGGGAVASEQALTEYGFGARPLFAALLAEQADKAAGMAIYYPDFSTHRGQPGVYVQDIFVTKAARGLGLGRGLLGAVMRAQDWGARYLTLGVSPDNEVALRFYARTGFRPRGYRFMILDGAALAALP